MHEWQLSSGGGVQSAESIKMTCGSKYERDDYRFKSFQAYVEQVIGDDFRWNGLAYMITFIFHDQTW